MPSPMSEPDNLHALHYDIRSGPLPHPTQNLHVHIHLDITFVGKYHMIWSGPLPHPKIPHCKNIHVHIHVDITLSENN